MTPQSQRQLVFLLLLGCLLSAFRVAAQSYHFQQYSVREGLAQSNVYDLLQDDRGTVWLGTASGASRFNGLEFENLGTANGLAPNGVRTLLCDKRGTLWLGHNGGGVSVITPDTTRVFLSLTGDITKLLEDRQGRIWAISATDGAIRINNPEAALETTTEPDYSYYKGQEGLSDRIFGLTQRTDGSLYFITDVGIKHYDEASDRFEFFRPEGLPGYFLPTCMLESSTGVLWFGTHNGGLYRYDVATAGLTTFDQLKDGLAHNFISTLAEDANGNIWAGTWGGGISRLGHDLSITNFSATNGMPDNKVRCILEDAEGNVLIGTNETGLQVFKSDQFVHYDSNNGLPNEQVWAVLETASGTMLAGTNEGVAIRNNTASNDSAWSILLNKSSGLPNNQVRHLKQAPNGRVWIGTWGGGVVSYELETGATDYDFELNYAIQFGNVTALDIGEDGTVWIGTIDGLLRHTPGEGTQRITQELDANGNTIGLPGNDVSMLFVENAQSILIGCRGKGYTRFNPQENSFYSQHTTGSFTPTCMLKQGDWLWIGTESRGLLRTLRDTGITRFTLENGLLSNFVTALSLDATDQLWVGTNRGLNKLANSGDQISSYAASEGFTGIEVKPNASYLDRAGQLWVGTVGGITINRPALEKPLSLAPPVHLLAFQANLETLALRANLALSHQQKNLIFRYNTVALSNPEAVRYKVRLLGLENTWREPSAGQQTTYPSVPPGSYTFEVVAINAAGIESATPASIAFEILPPFWKTWWFSTLCILLLAAGIAGWIKMRERALKQEKERLEVQVIERTAEVVQQKEALADANVQLEEQHRDIVDSIRYAERIQRAILPVESTMASHFKDVFVLFQPKDIVSGDFYWFAEAKGRIYFSAIDCTGHGVPGAFVSLIGNNGLQKAVNELGLTHPAEILGALREFVVNVFQQQGSGEAIRDGMDMALCAFDTNTRTLEYAGAKNPMYIVRNGAVEVIKGDKMPVGASDTDSFEPFTNHQFDLQEGDCVYLFSDGLPDQFGGPKGKKFKYRPFQELLLELHQQPMQHQKKQLSTTINGWMENHGAHYEQIDDILVLGARF